MYIILLLLLFVNVWVLWNGVLPLVSFHIQHQVSPWCMKRQSEKKERFYCGTQQTEASLQKAGKYDDSWIWWILGRCFLIKHCINLFEIMHIGIYKFNTVCIFYCFPECSNCDRITWWMQASCVIEPLRWNRWQKKEPVILNLSQPLILL